MRGLLRFTALVTPPLFVVAFWALSYVRSITFEWEVPYCRFAPGYRSVCSADGWVSFDEQYPVGLLRLGETSPFPGFAYDWHPGIYRQCRVAYALLLPPAAAPLALTYSAAALLRRARRRRRIKRGLCPGCAYDLTANRSGVCPECGAPVAAKP